MFEAVGDSLPVQWSTNAGATSWLAVVATTMLGSEQMSRSRAWVQADVGAASDHAAPASARFRLVVQSYVPGVLDDLGVPVGDARPSGSTQRFVTAEELRDGVWVDLVQLEAAAEAVLIAWIEWDEADLDFDALAARPTHDAWLACAPVGDETCRLILRCRAH